MSEQPLTPEEERQLRFAVSPSQTVTALRFGDASIRRLLATLDRDRSTPSVDGLRPLIGDILRKYGGTMKGRGDHDIYDALVRYRAALAATPTPAPATNDYAPDPNRTGMPKCPTCGDIAYQPDSMTGREYPWRCAECHYTLSRCKCAPTPAPNEKAQ